MDSYQKASFEICEIDLKYEKQDRRRQVLFSWAMAICGTTNMLLTTAVMVALVLSNCGIGGGAFLTGPEVHRVMIEFVNNTVRDAVEQLEGRIAAAEKVVESYNATLTLLAEFLQWKQTESTELYKARILLIQTDTQHCLL